MIPQGYELWLAEEYPEYGTAPVGRVIGWHGPALDPHDLFDAGRVQPVVVFSPQHPDGAGVSLPDEVRMPAPGTWFLGESAEEARLAAERYVNKRDEPAKRERQAAQARQAYEQHRAAARQDAETGDLRVLQQLIKDDMRRTMPRLAPVLEQATWKLADHGQVEVVLPRDTHKDLVPLYDKHLTHLICDVLGDDWKVTVVRAGWRAGR